MRQSFYTSSTQAKVAVLPAPREQRLTGRGLLLLAAIALLLLASVLSAQAAPKAPAFPEIIPLPNGWAPEGIASGRGNEFYAGSLANGAIYKGDLRTGEGSVLVQGVAGRAIAGLKVDPRTNYIFAAGTQSGMAFVFDGSTGAELAAYQLTTAPAFINDVVVTRDAAYFTNSFQPELYKLPLDPGGRLPDESAVETIPLSGDYQHVSEPFAFNANGIDATPNGKTLIIVQSARAALYTVDPATGDAEQIDLNGGSVPNGDGILLEGKTLYVVQNQLNRIAVIDLNLNQNEGEIVDTIAHPAFRVPTTIARFGSRLYAVNARFGTPVTPDTEYEVVQVKR